jgi:hypothetical protein
VENDASAKEAELDYLESKARQYAGNEARLREAVQRSGVTAELTHGAIVEHGEAVRALRDEVEPLLARLRGYRGLPPDVTLATLEVERARARLLQLEDDLAESMAAQ